MSASWTTPPIQAVGQVLTAAITNIGSDDLAYLYGDIGWSVVSTFYNGWGSANQVAYRLAGNEVWLKGWLSAGTANTTAFVLPTGYRPLQTANFAACCPGTTNLNVVAIDPSSGNVAPFQSEETSLDGVRFSVI